MGTVPCIFSGLFIHFCYCLCAFLLIQGRLRKVNKSEKSEGDKHSKQRVIAEN